MSDNLEDTRPRGVDLRGYTPPRNEVPAPPRFLLWGIIAIFLLGIVGSVAGVVIFRNVLQPAHQERVMGILPFMEAFMPPRPAAGETLPTPEVTVDEDISPEDLITGILPDDEEDAENAAGTPTLTPTSTPAPPTPTATTEPISTPTPEATATEVSAIQPTEVIVSNGDTNGSETTAGSAEANPVSSVPRARNARMFGFSHAQQTWNNCGPANITMALSYYGWQNDQTYAAQFLKPGGREDKNVSPSEMVTFVNENTDVRALTRMGGTLDLLRDFIASDIPVIIETGYTPEGYDWMGHYQTVVGYDDNNQIFWLYDSFLGSGENGEGIAENYDYLDEHWRHFNRQFIVIYEPQREEMVRRILGDYADPIKAAEISLELATEEATANPNNAFAWHNMGIALTALENYERAALAFDRARRNEPGIPWRMPWYEFSMYRAYYEDGRYSEILTLVDSNLLNGANWVEETYYWQGRALSALGRTNEAGTAFRRAIGRNPSYEAAQEALEQLNL